MKTRLLAPILMLVLVAACGGAVPGATSKAVATSGQAATSKPGAQVDCAAIEAAGQQLIAVQFLAQLTTPENVEMIKNKEFGNLDLDKFLAAIDDLRALESFRSPLGDPKAALDVYQKAAEAAKDLFATEPVTQVAIDQYKANVGTVSDFIGHQVAIAGAKDEAGC
jgi:hypothetical protein